ncbi:hypothetical protein EXIGLDRAFT_839431 [Exidia glandulosa HHB12029]|uniref:Uncharacterized protein n=1 Tax=Exidia glandulosa HHB12029 TaxID=1314781 RepID=A0A165F1E8_EXIGL|nr:hypothetical protein EXIGLDRAFT_839431 [Exidia glandulosa HHB12029]
MPLHTLIKIIDDTIQSTGTPYDALTPFEQHTREAMLAITVLAPLTGAFIAAAFAPRAKRDQPHGCPDFERQMRMREELSHFDRHKEMERMHLHKPLRFNRLVAYWFISIGIFGSVVYLQSGRTTRTTFVLAVFHNQVEVLLNCLLLKRSYQNSIAAAFVYGFIMYPIVLFASSMAWVFIGAAIVGGANDFLIVCILLYGRQWLLAAGALAHVFSAVAVFTCTIDNFGVLPYNLCIFLGLWIHIALTVTGILYAGELHGMMTNSEKFDLAGQGHRPNGTAPRHVAHTNENGLAGTPSLSKRAGKRLKERSLSSPDLHAALAHEKEKENGSALANGNGRVHHHRRPADDDDSEEHWLQHFAEENCRGVCYARNPMRHTNVPWSVVASLVIVSLVAAALVTVALCFWVPTWGSSPWGHTSQHPSSLSWLWNIFAIESPLGSRIASVHSPRIDL